MFAVVSLMTWFKGVSVALLLLAVNLGLAWALAGYFAAPPSRGEPYHLVRGWPRLPEAIKLGQVSGVDVDSEGHVFIFHRAERVWQGEEPALVSITSPTVLVLEGETGELLTQWGAAMFVLPHGLTIDDRDNVWLTDVGWHQVFKFDRTGKLLMTLGVPGVTGDDTTHFNMPTDVAVAPDGSFYVSDGYGNSRIVKFSPQGRFLAQWGSKGAGPNQFDVPHSLALDGQGRVYVADRGNSRLQIFNGAGQFITEWQGAFLGRPWAVRVGADDSVYVVDGGDQPVLFPDRARILKLDAQGNLLASFGSYGREPGQFTWPHDLAIGPDGALYVAEVSTGKRVQKFIEPKMSQE